VDIPQIISRPHGVSHDWVQQTSRSFEIIVWNLSLATGYKLNFRQV
jgi:hypothetical protein